MDIISTACIVYAVWVILDIFLEDCRRKVFENEWKKWLDEHPLDKKVYLNCLKKKGEDNGKS